MALHNFILSTNEDSSQLAGLLALSASDQRGSLIRLNNFLNQVLAGRRSLYLKVHRGAVQGFAELGIYADGTPAEGETVTVNGTTFTCVASGATGNQWNYSAGASTINAASIAASISGSATAGVVNCVSAASVTPTSLATAQVKITGVNAGAHVNGYVLAEVASATVIDNNFGSGSKGTEVILPLGLSAVTSNFTYFSISTAESSTLINALWALNATDAKDSLVRLINYFDQVLAGTRQAYLRTYRGAVKASATLVLSGLPSNNETFVLNGVTFTAKTSGATGNEFNIGGSASATATNIATAINASATAAVSNCVTAEASSGTVTITALEPGVFGMGYTLTESMSNTTRTAFASGSNGTEVILSASQSTYT